MLGTSATFLCNLSIFMRYWSPNRVYRIIGKIRSQPLETSKTLYTRNQTPLLKICLSCFCKLVSLVHFNIYFSPVNTASTEKACSRFQGGTGRRTKYCVGSWERISAQVPLSRRPLNFRIVIYASRFVPEPNNGCVGDKKWQGSTEQLIFTLSMQQKFAFLILRNRHTNSLKRTRKKLAIIVTLDQITKKRFITWQEGKFKFSTWATCRYYIFLNFVSVN